MQPYCSPNHLQATEGVFENHADFSSAYRHYLTASSSSTDGAGATLLMMTYSPIIHLEGALGKSAHTKDVQVQQVWSLRQWCWVGAALEGTNDRRHLQASEFSSERELKECVSGFLHSTAGPATLILQCDPVACRQALINHVRCDR
jgi:hypothetical protein